MIMQKSILPFYKGFQKARVLIVLLLVLLPAAPAATQGVRILSQEVALANDSLHLFLKIDLSGVNINRHTAVHFTPTLSGSYAQLPLAPIVLSGKKRYRFDRREWVLRTPSEVPPTAPYAVLIQTRRHRPDVVNYHTSIPYSTWMHRAALLLNQQVKDCCELEWLCTDTLALCLSDLSAGLPETKEYAFAPAPAEMPVPAKDLVEEMVQSVILNPTQETPEPEYTPQPEAIPEQKPAPALVPDEEPNTETIILYIDYPVGKEEVFPYYSDNHRELLKLNRIFNQAGNFLMPTLKEVQVCGYCSPDGTYANNERLAASRARFFAEYLHATYKLNGLRIVTSAVAEDWEGLCDLIHDDTP